MLGCTCFPDVRRRVSADICLAEAAFGRVLLAPAIDPCFEPGGQQAICIYVSNLVQ